MGLAPARSNVSAGARTSLGYRPELDGIRALAVLAVVIFHGQAMLPAGSALWGGWIGVDIFFVLSGYLITSLLVAEHRSTSDVSLPLFYLRRGLRILPPMILMVVLAGVVYVHTGHNYHGSRPFGASVILAFSFVGNWFQATTNLGLVGHTWSLAIEEQFYVAWPFVFAIAMRRGRSMRAMAGALFGGAAVVVGVRLLLVAAEQGQASFFWTIARSDGILLGTSLALVLVHRPPILMRIARSWLVGAVAVAGLLAASVGCGRILTSYQCGMPIATVSATVLIAHLTAAPGGTFGRVLSIAPLRSIGRISYGIYLFHWPIAVWLAGSASAERGGVRFGVLIAGTFAIAVPSYFLLERPVMRRYASLAPAVQRRRRIRPPRRLASPSPAYLFAPVAGVVAATVIVVAGVWVAGSQGAAPTDPNRVAVAGVVDGERVASEDDPSGARAARPPAAPERQFPAGDDEADAASPRGGDVAVVTGPGGCDGVHDVMGASRSARADAAHATTVDPPPAGDRSVLRTLGIAGFEVASEGAREAPVVDTAWRWGYVRRWRPVDPTDESGVVSVSVDEFSSVDAALAYDEHVVVDKCAAATGTFVLTDRPEVTGVETRTSTSPGTRTATFVGGKRRYAVESSLVTDADLAKIASITRRQFEAVR